MIIEDFIHNIIKFKNRLLNGSITNLEYESSMFFIYLVDTIKYLTNEMPEVEYNLINFYKKIDNEINISKKPCIEILKKNKKVKNDQKKINIVISEYINNKEDATKTIDILEKNCWEASYKYLISEKENKQLTLYVKRGLYLKYLLAYVSTYYNFIFATSDEILLQSLNKFIKIFYSPNIKKIIQNKVLVNKLSNCIYNYDKSDDLFINYSKYSDHNKLIIWKFLDKDSKTEFHYMSNF
jgi:hypothetical protein